MTEAKGLSVTKVKTTKYFELLAKSEYKKAYRAIADQVLSAVKSNSRQLLVACSDPDNLPVVICAEALMQQLPRSAAQGLLKERRPQANPLEHFVDCLASDKPVLAKAATLKDNSSRVEQFTAHFKQMNKKQRGLCLDLLDKMMKNLIGALSKVTPTEELERYRTVKQSNEVLRKCVTNTKQGT